MTGLNALHQLKGNGIWAVKFMERDINGKEFLFGIYQYEPQTGHVTELGQTGVWDFSNHVSFLLKNLNELSRQDNSQRGHASRIWLQSY